MDRFVGDVNVTSSILSFEVLLLCFAVAAGQRYRSFGPRQNSLSEPCSPSDLTSVVPLLLHDILLLSLCLCDLVVDSNFMVVVLPTLADQAPG